jgi:hypothetical protein
MYANPSLIRRHTVAVRFNDKEAELVQALVNYTGAEKAAYIRDLVLTMAVQVLHDADGAATAEQLRAG